MTTLEDRAEMLDADVSISGSVTNGAVMIATPKDVESGEISEGKVAIAVEIGDENKATAIVDRQGMIDALF